MAKRKSPTTEDSRFSREPITTPSQPHVDGMASEMDSQPPSSKAIRQYAIALIQLTAAMIVVGYVLTAAGVWMNGYMELPNQGQVTFTQEGAERFVHSNEHFAKYAIRTGEDPHGRYDSHLKGMGFPLTSFYFQVVVNALHKTFAVEWRNLGVLLFLPIVVLTGAGFVFYRSLPRPWRTFDNVVMHMSVLGAVHATALSILLVMGYLASSSMRAIFAHSAIFYPPDFVGSLLGGIVLLILSGVFYGALSGVLVYVLRLSEAPIFTQQKPIPRVQHK